jgi:hypothetical protein
LEDVNLIIVACFIGNGGHPNDPAIAENRCGEIAVQNGMTFGEPLFISPNNRRLTIAPPERTLYARP